MGTHKFILLSLPICKSRITPNHFEQRLIHLHYQLNDLLSKEVHTTISIIDLSKSYPYSVPFWFKKISLLIARYMGCRIYTHRVLLSDSINPIRTIRIAGYGKDAILCAGYLRFVLSFIREEMKYQTNRYKNKKRKIRRKIKRGTLGVDAKKTFNLQAKIVGTKTREIINSRIITLLTELHNLRSDLFPEARLNIKIRLRNLDIHFKSNTWKKHEH